MAVARDGTREATGLKPEWSVTVVQNINTPDVASFRRSQSQLATEAASAMSRAANRNL